MNEREIFNVAVKLTNADRSGYLDLACQDKPELRGQVEALLKAHLDSAMFLHESDDDQIDLRVMETMPQTGLAENPGTIIAGRYKLLEEIGEGGMGSVWLAEQREPVRRKVALKLIKAGMDSKSVLARFDAERQALALMDHPNIAKVFDGGMTDQGRPFFVMEYVKGMPLTEYCDQARLSLKERLNLFTPVCQAVQHAHQKGIIHRDLKPSNILICLYDGQPVPKVIDFGLAKAMHQSLTEQSLHTAHGVMVGTPLYMSPEQAEHNNLDVDTRTDIYSLGVILYELLTGSTPLEKLQLKEAAFNEVLRLIKEVDPPKPSTRLSSSLSLPSIAAQRSIEPNQLKKSLIGDLDWIVMKALDKERSRRYETANGLARDVERFLNDEAVEACPPSTAYKFRKYIRRNRGQVIAAVTVLAVLLLGMAGTTGGMIWANRERALAEAEKSKATLAAVSEAEAKVAAQANEQKAISAAKRAEASKEQEAKARKRAETISEFVTAALKASDAQNAGGGQEMTILAAMDNAIKDIDSGRFKDDPETEAKLKNTIATILKNNGRAKEAEPLFVQALEMHQRLHKGDHPNVSASLNNVADVWQALGRFVEAEPLYVEALEMRQRLYEGDHPEVATSLNNLAHIRHDLGRAAEAEPLYVQALEMDRRIYKGDCTAVADRLNNVAFVRQALGRAAEAEPLFAQSMEMYQRLYNGDHPRIAMCLNNLAFSRNALGRSEEAELLFVQALEMSQRLFRGDHQDVAVCMDNLAAVRHDLGRAAEAEPLYVEALEMRQRLFKGDHPNVANSLSNLGILRQELGRFAEAEPLLLQALDMYQRLFKGDHPSVAMGLTNLGNLRQARGRAVEAEPLLVQALEMSRRRYKGDHPDVAKGLGFLAGLRQDLGRAAEAEPLYVEALEMYQRLFKSDHERVAESLNNLAQVRLVLGRAAEAEPLFVRALEMAQRLHGGDHPGVASTLDNLARTRQELGRLVEADALMVEALDMRQRLFKGDHPEVAKGLHHLAQVRLALGLAAEAEPLLVEVMEIIQRNFEDHPDVAVTMVTLARARQALGKTAEARQGYDDAIAMYRRVSPTGSPTFARALWYSGSARLDNRDAAAALPELEEAVSMAEKFLPPEHPQRKEYRETLGKCKAALEEKANPPADGDK